MLVVKVCHPTIGPHRRCMFGHKTPAVGIDHAVLFRSPGCTFQRHASVCVVAKFVTILNECSVRGVDVAIGERRRQNKAKSAIVIIDETCATHVNSSVTFFCHYSITGFVGIFACHMAVLVGDFFDKQLTGGVIAPVFGLSVA